ncbi:MAG TPA: flagellar biosynthetic protein FliO [Syntrophorhabdaceae bacterium]|nr:flagellar biosynthetic protein FliO [Syntrophorhabdaceae bacterium]
MIDVYTGIAKIVFIMIGIIAGIILFSRYAAKIKLPFRTEEQSYNIKKVGSLYMGYKKFISVVEINNHVLVVGGGDKELSLLAKWKKEDTAV